MKFLHLKFSHAKVVKESNKAILFGSNDFLHPLNSLHVYNALCVLLDRTPKPQLRATDDIYMPFYDDIMAVVVKGYIKTTLITKDENISTVKKAWNSNAMNSSQYTWVDCRYSVGTLLPVFVYHLSNILNKSEQTILDTPFDAIIDELHSKGVKQNDDLIEYTDKGINDLITWCQRNQCGGLTNYIQNTQISSRPTQFGKRIYRGSVETNKYNGDIYIPLTDELIDELINHTKGHATILDGGLVKIIGFNEVDEDEISDFTEIYKLNSSKKYNTTYDKVKNVVDTIYNKIDSNNVTKSIKKLIAEVGVEIEPNQLAYDNMMAKIEKIKPSDTKAIANKLNFFLENAINNQYK